MLSESFITTMESFIADESKKIHNKTVRLDLLTMKSMNTLDKLIWHRGTGFEYYGIPYHEFGIKTMAFYKSLSGTIYSIELADECLISYYEVFKKY